MEEERLTNLSRVLHQMSEADINVLSIAAAVHRLSADKIDSAEPHSDLRLFIHNKVVDLMLRQTAAAQRATAEKVGSAGQALLLLLLLQTHLTSTPYVAKAWLSVDK